MQGVSADSASDVWVSGYWYNGSTSKYVPYLMHYNGYYWAQFDAPSGYNSAQLQGVTVVSGDAWAGGQNIPSGSSLPSPLIYKYS